MDEKIRNEVKEEIVKWEDKYNVRCVVVNNTYSHVGLGGNVLTLSLMVLPLEGESGENPGFQKRATDFNAEWNDLTNWAGKRKWHCLVSLGLSDWSAWFKRFKDDPEKFPLSDMASGAKLISEVLYGQELMDEIHRQAKVFFGEHIIDFWKTEADKQFKEREERMEKLEREYAEYLRERRKLLNKHELEELKELVFHLAKVCPEENIRLIVALDGSGRPVGEAIKWFLNGTVTLAHMDPHQIKELDFDNKKAVQKAAEIFRKEFFGLCVLLKENPDSVLFVDDQTGYGNTYESLKKFVKVVTGRNVKPKLAVMSGYQTDNTPSWLRKRRIQGIKLAPKGSFIALDNPTPQSEKFYGELQTHVLRWKEEFEAK